MAKVSTPAGIVAKIMAALKLGEEGKIGSFFNKLESDFNREIKAIKHNISGLEFEHEQRIEKLNEELEDAEKAVEDAWMNVTADRVATNAAQDSFKNDYLSAITMAEKRVSNIKNDIKDAKGEYKEKLEDLNDQISKYEARLARIRG
jgi:prefoldin subunit 5